jgi:hypothetical protein
VPIKQAIAIVCFQNKIRNLKTRSHNNNVIPLPKTGNVKINSTEALNIAHVNKHPCVKNIPHDLEIKHDTKNIIEPPSDEIPSKCRATIAMFKELDE